MLLGIDNLIEKKDHLVKLLPLAVVTTEYTTNLEGVKTCDRFIRDDFNLKLFVNPPQGFYVEEEHLTNYENIPVIGIDEPEFSKNLKKLKIVVFDMQHIGVKNSIVVKMLYDIMSVINGKDITLIVTDRPNPIYGDVVNGIIGEYSRVFLPLRHGLTLCELASFLKEEIFRDVKLTNITMEGYKRSFCLDELKPEYNKTIPYLNDYQAFYMYPGFHLFNSVNISLGLGTEFSCDAFGAPWIDSDSIYYQLSDMPATGYEMQQIAFTPTKGIHKGRECYGLKFRITDKNSFNSIELFLNILEICYNNFSELEFLQSSRGNYIIDEFFGDPRIRKSLEKYIPLDNVYYKAANTLEEYMKKREKILLY